MENDEGEGVGYHVTWPGLASTVLFLVMWVVGWILAKGFWSTFFAVFFFPWGWYLAIEKIMMAWGWL